MWSLDQQHLLKICQKCRFLSPTPRVSESVSLGWPRESGLSRCCWSGHHTLRTTALESRPDPLSRRHLLPQKQALKAGLNPLGTWPCCFLSLKGAEPRLLMTSQGCPHSPPTPSSQSLSLWREPSHQPQAMTNHKSPKLENSSGETAGMSTSPPTLQKGTGDLLQGQKTRAGLLISCSSRHHHHHTSFPFPPLEIVLTMVTSGPLPAELPGKPTSGPLMTQSNGTFQSMCVCLSCVRLFETLWTVAREAPLSTGFSRQEYWSGLPSLSPGIKPRTLAL